MNIKFKRLTPFKRCVLQNFPFIEADFDALTNYGLLCKVVEYLNKVIKSQDEVQVVTEQMVTAFNNLYDYVNNYFDNLDVQEEINNKLDQMAEDGTLQEIVASYLQANVTWTFKSVSEMKSATNLVDDSYARTIGYYAENDGGGAIYYITSTQPETYYETLDSGLYAQLITNGVANVKQFGAKGNGIVDDTTAIQTAMNAEKTVFIPNGTYCITHIEFNSGQRLEGASRSATILKLLQSNNTSMITNATYNPLNSYIGTMTLEGDRENITSEIDAIMLDNGNSGADTHTNIVDVYIHGFTGCGINTNYQREIRIKSCYIRDIDKQGILFHNTSDSTIEDVICCKCGQEGIRLETGANRIANSKCFYNGFVTRNPYATPYTQRKSGIYTRSRNNTFTNVHAQENAGHGFFIEDAYNIILSACVADNNGLYLDENGTRKPLSDDDLDPYYSGIYLKHCWQSRFECAFDNFNRTTFGEDYGTQLNGIEIEENTDSDLLSGAFSARNLRGVTCKYNNSNRITFDIGGRRFDKWLNTNGVVNLAEGWTQSAICPLTVERNGNIVMITGSVTTSTDMDNTSLTLFEIPSGFEPTTEYSTGYCGGKANEWNVDIASINVMVRASNRKVTVHNRANVAGVRVLTFNIVYRSDNGY